MIGIIGLGNPGEKYQDTRHNVGFKVVDKLAQTNQLTAVNQKKLDFVEQSRLKAEIARSHFKKSDLLLAKPTTFVNNSGQTVTAITQWQKIKPCNIWVICDDLSLPIGMIRSRTGGSSGGHNGLADIIERLGTEKFPRLRLGIKPTKGFEKESPEFQESLAIKKFVLAPFTKREQKILEKATAGAVKLLLESLAQEKLPAITIA
jgi:peptidyl-tRNA hydrolase, PTH1 family